MGFKGKQNLTSCGYKERHKKKLPITSVVSVESKLYKQYKRMYDNLREKYDTPKQKAAIDSIMGRTMLATRISSEQNRQLVLLDTDKMLSLAMAAIKPTDQRFGVMRLVLETAEGREDNRMYNRWGEQTLRRNQLDGRDGLERELERMRERRIRREERMRLEGQEQMRMELRQARAETIRLDQQEQLTREMRQRRQERVRFAEEPQNIFRMTQNPFAIPQLANNQVPGWRRIDRPINPFLAPLINDPPIRTTNLINNTRAPDPFGRTNIFADRNPDPFRALNIFEAPIQRRHIFDPRQTRVETNATNFFQLYRTRDRYDMVTNERATLPREGILTNPLVQPLPATEVNRAETVQGILPIESDVSNSEGDGLNRPFPFANLP